MSAIDTRQDAGFSTSPIGRLARSWALGTGVAVVLVAATYLLADAFSGPLAVTGVGEIALGNVVGFTVLGSTVGVAMAFVIGRFTRTPRLTFIAVALIALAGYAVVPFTAAESVVTAIWLNIFHLVVAIPIIGLLTRSLPKDRAGPES